MNKDELIKELEELRDTKNYSQSELLNTGYRTAILDAIDLVKKLTIPIVSQQRELLVAYEKHHYTPSEWALASKQCEKEIDQFLATNCG